jgi:hypothetical protein
MLCDVGGTVDRQALVAALKAVHGVADADVDPDDTGGLGTLRLDLVAGVDETAVANQVSRVLREQFGLGVDADRVELVEVPTSETDDQTEGAAADQGPEEAAVPELAGQDEAVTDQPAAQAIDPPVFEEVATSSESDTGPDGVTETRSFSVPEPRASRRPSIAKIHLVSSGLDVTASVTLASGTRTAAGEAHGVASQSGVHKAVAMATLRAVEELVGGAVRVELEHLEVTMMGSERTVVVRLTLLSHAGTELLTGAAAVREDVRQAVIRATLDALNRRLELLLSEV